MVKTFPPLVILLSGKIKKSNGFRLSFPSVSVTTAPSACYQLKLRHNHVQQTTVLNPHPTLHSGSETPAAAGNSVVGVKRNHDRSSLSKQAKPGWTEALPAGG